MTNFTKSMFKGSIISVKLNCKGDSKKFNLQMSLVTKLCNGNIGSEKKVQQEILNVPCHEHILLDKKKLDLMFLGEQAKTKMEPPIKPTTKHTLKPTTKPKIKISKSDKTKSKTTTPKHLTTVTKTTSKGRKKRAVEDPGNNLPAKDPGNNPPAEDSKQKTPVQKSVGENNLPPVNFKSVYVLTLLFVSSEELTIDVVMQSTYRGSYLSARTWPLLPFFGSMSLLYLVFAIGWLIASCCNWRDLLRVQFWIGGVIALGMFENALFYTEYRNVSSTGEANGLLYFAEIVSCVKKALARILVVIVSMGFGIVKPRLGQTLHKVLAAGGLYFLIASVEGCMRVRDGEIIAFKDKKHMTVLIPLIVMDVVICWWVFTSLVQTTRTLRIRKNLIKLSLYRHFTNTLIFAVVASLAYMIWMIKEGRFNSCIDMTTLWLNDALWPFLFALILAVIMVLWRPSINNQRYAFTPLGMGDSDDENDDMTLSDAFEGMKMRNKSDSSLNGGTYAKNRLKAEDDLKWVEENIPSVPSTLLPTLDSDEEIIMTKFETSKMD